MQGLFDFIVKPKTNRYDNIKKIDNKELILNTEIFSHQYVSRVGIVLEYQPLMKQILALEMKL